MTKVLVTGSRDWTDKKVIHDALDDIVVSYSGPYTLIHGDCPTGADKIAADYATELKWEIIPEPADWEKYKRSAGPIRNQKMINTHKPNVALAFSLNESTGTAHCIGCLRQFKRKNPLILLNIQIFSK